MRLIEYINMYYDKDFNESDIPFMVKQQNVKKELLFTLTLR